MKKLCFFILLLSTWFCARAAYLDHRVERLDSLETLVSGWTPERLDKASQEESEILIGALYGLIRGYRNTDGERSVYFARKCYRLAKRWNWLNMMECSTMNIGLFFYGREQFDSAMVYFQQALALTDRMAAGECSKTSDKPYEESIVDDNYSQLYGSLANLYNMMDSIPVAMEYYKKAGKIFEKHGWNESNSILWHNMGETWYDEADFREARKCYEKALDYALAAGDSLQISGAMKGLGAVYLQEGRTAKALEYLQEADKYYSLHSDQEFTGRLETLDIMTQVLEKQKRTRAVFAGGAMALLVLLAALQLMFRQVRRLKRQGEAADDVINEALGDYLEDADIPAGTGRAHKPTQSADGATPELTAREKEILPLIATGYTSQQIADTLYLSLPTIKWYRRKLLEKFDAANTADLIAIAKGAGLV